MFYSPQKKCRVFVTSILVIRKKRGKKKKEKEKKKMEKERR